MKFFLALLASQQTLAESGVDGSCVAEEVSLMQSRHRAAKENETVQMAAGRRRSWALQYLYLSAPGASECVGGSRSPNEKHCKGSVLNLSPYEKQNMRGLQVGSGGSCNDGGWGQVPTGCSVQSGGDWAAHYKTGSPQPSGCVHQDYQLVCRDPQGWPEAPFYWAHYGQKTCNGGGLAVSAFACRFAVNWLFADSYNPTIVNYGGTMNRLAYDESHDSCNGDGWGKVPTGCSARTEFDMLQTDVDWDSMGRYPHFRNSGDSDCASDEYQLVCTTPQS